MSKEKRILCESDEYNNYYVAFIDILGFKELIYKKTSYEMCNIFNTFLNKVEKIKLFNSKTLKFEAEDIPTNKIKKYVMSDTIVYYIEEKEKNSLLALVICCSGLLTNLIEKERIFVRGSIVCGNMYCKNDVIFGPALSKAYTLEKEIAVYPRIIINKQLIENELSKMGNKYIHELKSFIRLDFDKYYCVKNTLPNNNNNFIREILSYLDNELNTIDDKKIRDKLLYLYEYYSRIK